MTKRQGSIGVVAVVAGLVCWAGTALAQPFPGGLPACQAQLSACQLGAQAFPATGQTTCWNNDGDVAYLREVTTGEFVDSMTVGSPARHPDGH